MPNYATEAFSPVRHAFSSIFCHLANVKPIGRIPSYSNREGVDNRQFLCYKFASRPTLDIISTPGQWGEGTVFLKTRLFKLYPRYYRNLSQLAHAMGISVSEVSRVRSGKRNINQKFIIGALNAFPQFSFDELFYLAPGSPTDDMPSPAGVTSYMRQSVDIYRGSQEEELIISPWAP